MDVYILRHGIAESRPGGPDADRALTDEGREKLRKVLLRARAAGVEPSLILTSPFRRAVETAELAAEILKYQHKVSSTDALLPDSTPESVWSEIRAHRGEDAILLTGHEPLLSAAVAYLLGAPSVQVDLKKGALVALEMDRIPAVFRWMLIPKLA